MTERPDMNEPQTFAKIGWEPLVYFWDGGWIGVGVSPGTVPPHSHHAVQISIGIDGPVRFRHGEGEWVDMPVGVVLPNEPHQFDGLGSLVAMVFVDPESSEGRWLRDSLTGPISSIERERVAEHLPGLETFHVTRPDALSAARTITGVVHALCAGPPPIKRMDERIVKAMEWMRESGSRTLSLEDAARSVFLSPSRFAHLFKEEVGLPFRRYLLWRKLSRGIVEFGRGSNLSAAAHAAGFSDSAHLTHTWKQMFGISPTVMAGSARFYEIPAPFELAAAQTR
jgi:AraC family transcriptional regulator